MFNRSTKLTALLVAAASVASMTPVMAVEKLNQKDGTVKEGIAYDNGKYAYYGYRSEDDDETFIYYNSGSGKDKKMDDDLENYEIKDAKTSKYGTKYVYATEDGNNDEYLIDISTGKVVDDETAESKQEAATGKLVSALKKVERYNQTSDSAHTIRIDDVDTVRLFQNQFGDVWYQYVTTGNGASIDKDSNTLNGANADDAVATTAGAVSVDNNGTADAGYFGETGIYTGFFDENGKYVDASYTANLKIYNAKQNKAVKIEKYNKLYKDQGIKARLKALKPLAQDKDNIYALATVDVEYYNADYSAIEQTVTQYFVQKISKSREKSTGADDAYLPKDVVSYQVDNKANPFFEDSDDSRKVATILAGTEDGSVSDAEEGRELYAVKGDYLYVSYLTSSDKVHVYKLKLGTKKLDVVNDDVTNLVDTNKFASNKIGVDIDVNIVTLKEDDDHDAEGGMKAVSVDTEGNTWVIHKGKIAMFDDTEFKDQYSTDRSYNALDVYDKNSLIAWDYDSDSYTTVQEGKKQTVDDAQVIDPSLVNKTDDNTTVKTGWVQEADGTWSLYDATGAKTVGWANVSGTWYYMNAAGAMQTGWVQDAGKWYYLNPVSDGTKGAMKTGWIYDNGTWYYLESSGAMAASKWIQDNGTWYYLKASGAMAASEYVDGYYVNASGAWV